MTEQRHAGPRRGRVRILGSSQFEAIAPAAIAVCKSIGLAEGRRGPTALSVFDRAGSEKYPVTGVRASEDDR